MDDGNTLTVSLDDLEKEQAPLTVSLDELDKQQAASQKSPSDLANEALSKSGLSVASSHQAPKVTPEQQSLFTSTPPGEEQDTGPTGVQAKDLGNAPGDISKAVTTVGGKMIKGVSAGTVDPLEGTVNLPLTQQDTMVSVDDPRSIVGSVPGGAMMMHALGIHEIPSSLHLTEPTPESERPANMEIDLSGVKKYADPAIAMAAGQAGVPISPAADITPASVSSRSVIEGGSEVAGSLGPWGGISQKVDSLGLKLLEKFGIKGLSTVPGAAVAAKVLPEIAGAETDAAVTQGVRAVESAIARMQRREIVRRVAGQAVTGGIFEAIRPRQGPEQVADFNRKQAADNLTGTASELGQLHDQLQQSREQLEAAQAKVNPKDKASVDAFNQQAAAHNALLQQYQQKAQLFNRASMEFNNTAGGPEAMSTHPEGAGESLGGRIGSGMVIGTLGGLSAEGLSFASKAAKDASFGSAITDLHKAMSDHLLSQQEVKLPNGETIEVNSRAKADQVAKDLLEHHFPPDATVKDVRSAIKAIKEKGSVNTLKKEGAGAAPPREEPPAAAAAAAKPAPEPTPKTPAGGGGVVEANLEDLKKPVIEAEPVISASNPVTRGERVVLDHEGEQHQGTVVFAAQAGKGTWARVKLDDGRTVKVDQDDLGRPAKANLKEAPEDEGARGHIEAAGYTYIGTKDQASGERSHAFKDEQGNIAQVNNKEAISPEAVTQRMQETNDLRAGKEAPTAAAATASAQSVQSNESSASSASKEAPIEMSTEHKAGDSVEISSVDGGQRERGTVETATKNGVRVKVENGAVRIVPAERVTKLPEEKAPESVPYKEYRGSTGTAHWGSNSLEKGDLISNGHVIMPVSAMQSKDAVKFSAVKGNRSITQARGKEVWDATIKAKAKAVIFGDVRQINAMHSVPLYDSKGKFVAAIDPRYSKTVERTTGANHVEARDNKSPVVFYRDSTPVAVVMVQSYKESDFGGANAVQKPGAGAVLQRESGEAGKTGSERGGVESGQQGKEAATEGAGARTARSGQQGAKETPAEVEARQGEEEARGRKLKIDHGPGSETQKKVMENWPPAEDVHARVYDDSWSRVFMPKLPKSPKLRQAKLENALKESRAELEAHYKKYENFRANAMAAVTDPISIVGREPEERIERAAAGEGFAGGQLGVPLQLTQNHIVATKTKINALLKEMGKPEEFHTADFSKADNSERYGKKEKPKFTWREHKIVYTQAGIEAHEITKGAEVTATHEGKQVEGKVVDVTGNQHGSKVDVLTKDGEITSVPKETVGAKNYTDEELAAFKAKHNIPEVKSELVGAAAEPAPTKETYGGGPFTIYKMAGLTPRQRHIEKKVAEWTQKHPELAIERLLDLPDSQDGRYISGDLAREIYPEYNASAAARTEYDLAVANSAAAVAKAAFEKQLKTFGVSTRVVLLAGNPGAGKTTMIKDDDLNDPAKAHVLVYEASLSNESMSAARLQEVIDAGHKPVQMYVHADPLVALRGVLDRAGDDYGRTVPIDTQVNLITTMPKVLAELEKQFGDRVRFNIFDYSDRSRGPQQITLDYLLHIAYTGDANALRQELQDELDKQHASGRISDAIYDAVRSRKLGADRSNDEKRAEGSNQKEGAQEKGGVNGQLRPDQGRAVSHLPGEDREPLGGAVPQGISGSPAGGNADRDSDGRGQANGERAPSEPVGGASVEPSTGAGAGSLAKPVRAQKLKNRDWFTHPEDFSVDATPTQRLDWNLKALELIHEVNENGRKLTEEERSALAHYVGWGSLPHTFAPYNAPFAEQRKWNEAHGKLKELLTEQQLDEARRSTTAAHYTSPTVVRWMWQAVAKMGFKGGVILEPSMGSGNFFGMMPKGIRGASTAIGNELDPSTYKIAALLYPSATVFNKDFKDLVLPNESVDVVIGNPPFGENIYDPKYPKLKARIHDYFFVKALDKLRPGGVLAFVTSTGTLDKQNPVIRNIIRDQADLLLAVRLPSSAFDKSAGTTVVTDVIFLRKRAPNTAYAGEKFIETKPLSEHENLPINEYYVAHPENILGTLETRRGRYRDEQELTVKAGASEMQERLTKALEQVPRDGYQKRTLMVLPNEEMELAPVSLEEGNFTVNDKGELKQRINGALVTPSVVLDKAGKPSPPLVDRLKRLVALREGTRELIELMRSLDDSKEANDTIAVSRSGLKKFYDRYVDKHGYLNDRRTKTVFDSDPHYPLLLSLEHYDRDTKLAAPADIFTKRTIFPAAKLTALSTEPKEALYQVLAERGFPDLEFMSALGGKKIADLEKSLTEQGLIFKNPLSGIYESRDKYLSGYVRDKLADAEAALKQGDKSMQRNVDELKRVIPANIPIKDISVKLGATYLKPAAIKDFIQNVLNGGYYSKVSYLSGTWKVQDVNPSAEVTAQFAGGGVKADQLLEDALNLRTPIIRTDVIGEDGKSKKGPVDQQKTVAAQAALDKIYKEFERYISTHPKWAPEIEETYNQLYNNLVTPEYDGSHLTFPGMNTAHLRDGRLDPHQVNAIWRIIQDGRALLGHVVGAGKTYEMVAASAELKRLGKIKKPMFAVPNHKVSDWAEDFLKLYPTARLLVPTKKDFQAVNRNRLMAKIATNEWDGIIVAHSQFNMMDISPERQQVTLDKEMDELENTINAVAEAEGKKSRSVKQLENAKDRLRAKMDALKNLKADKTILFDSTGVDQLFVDEAHEYKNLAFYTKMNRVSGLSQGNAKRATRLKMKTDYLLEKNNNRGVVFATGTPVSNTMAELRHMINYVAPDVLEKAGIRFFDDWAANFGQKITAMELSPDGRNFKARTKFAQFINVPEMQMQFRSFADIKTQEDLKLPIPRMETGKPIIVSVPSTEITEPGILDCIRRAKILRGEAVEELDDDGKPILGPDEKPLMRQHEKPDPHVDNMLKVTGDGRRWATDARLMNPDLPDHPKSKINAVVDKLYDEWLEGKDAKTTQAVFLDQYRYVEEVGGEYNSDGKKIKAGKEVERLNLYHDMRDKLIARGVPAEEIGIIGDYNNDEKKAGLFRAMNSGRVRILFGSTARMGAGMNAQKKMKALHHIDAPWKPGELEQRNGRILRQGNDNEEVRIYNYNTKGSFDAYMFQTLKTKAEFINQVMSGNFHGRSMTDAASDMILSLEEMMASSSGNPDIKRKMELEASLVRYQSLLREQQSNVLNYRVKAGWERERAGRLHAGIEKLKEVADKWNAATAGDKFSMHILGQDFDEYGKAATWLKDQPVPPTAFHFTLNGVELRADSIKGSSFSTSDQGGTRINQDGDLAYYVPYEATPHTVEGGMGSLLPSINGRLAPKHMENRIKAAADDAASALTKAEKLEKLSDEGGFEEAAEMAKVSKELEEVNIRLGISEAKAAMEENVAADVDSGADEEENPEEDSEADESVAPFGWDAIEAGNRQAPAGSYEPSEGAVPPVITINKAARDLLRKAVPEMRPFLGVSMGKVMARRWAERLGDRLNVAEDYEEQRAIERMAQMFEKAADDAGHSGVIVSLDGADKVLAEEMFHSAQRELGAGATERHLGDEAVRLLLDSPTGKKAADWLVANGYEGKEDALLVAETAAKIAVFDSEIYDLLTPEEAAGWFVDYLDAVAAAHGADALKNMGAVIAQESADFYEQAVGRVNDRRKVTDEAERGRGEGQGGNGEAGQGIQRERAGPTQAGAGGDHQAGAAKEGSIALARPPVVAPFFLKSEKLVTEKMGGSSSGFGVLQMLRNNGVKPDELKWTGLDDFLKDKTKVSKPAVLDFLKKNDVHVEEVHKGKEPQKKEAEEIDWPDASHYEMRQWPFTWSDTNTGDLHSDDGPFEAHVYRPMDDNRAYTIIHYPKQNVWQAWEGDADDVERDLNFSRGRNSSIIGTREQSYHDAQLLVQQNAEDDEQYHEEVPTEEEMALSAAMNKYQEAIDEADAAREAIIPLLKANLKAKNIKQSHLATEVEDRLNNFSQSWFTPSHHTYKGELGKAINKYTEAMRKQRAAAQDKFNAETAVRVSRSSTTRWSQYMLPGGENYRELLLTLPEATTEGAKATFVFPDGIDADEFLNDVSAEGLEHLEIGHDPDNFSKVNIEKVTPADLETLKRAATIHNGHIVDQQKDVAPAFTTSHWDEKNVLAHVRFTDRTASDGAKIIFLEELQSDWHQQGRKRGYIEAKTAAEIEIIKAKVEEAEAEAQRIYAEGGLGDSGTTGNRGPFNALHNQAADYAAKGDMVNAEKYRDIVRRYQLAIGKVHRLEEQLYSNDKVPDAPFKSTWPELSLKRMLRYAAEHGYDRLGWTTGAQQNQRYNLSQHIDTLHWRPLNAHAMGAPGMGYLSGDKNNVEDVFGKEMKESELPEYVGKEVAAKLLEQPLKPRKPGGSVNERGSWMRKSLTMRGLEVGGSGMKGFYDKIVPDFLNRYGKKWGAQVGTSEFESTPKSLQQDMVGAVHSFPITKAMKDSVLHEGQPMFALPPAPAGGGGAGAAPAPAQKFSFTNPDTEKEFEEARGLTKPGALDNIRETIDRFVKMSTRTYEHLPRGAAYEPLRFELKKLEKARTMAGDRAARTLHEITSKLDETQFYNFTVKVVLDDLLETMKDGLDVPFYNDRASLERDHAAISDHIAKDEAVQDALRIRAAFWSRLKSTYVGAMEAIGFKVANRLQRESYYRHQVLEYANAKGAFSGQNSKLKTPTGRGFLKQRTGSQLPINTDYIQAEHEVMANFLFDVQVAKTIKFVEENYNIVNDLKREAMQMNHEGIMEHFREIAELERDPTITAEKLYKALNRKQAIGIDRLKELAARNALPNGFGKNDFTELIEELADSYNEDQADRADLQDAYRTTVGQPAQLSNTGIKSLIRYAAWVIHQGASPAKFAALTLFKGIAEKKKYIKQNLGDRFVTWKDLVPDSHTIWQPREGSTLYFTKSVPEQVAEELFSGAADSVGITKDQLRSVLARGNRFREYAVPNEVAQTLDHLRPDAATTFLGGMARPLVKAWKWYELSSPRRFVRFRMRHISGQAEAMFVGNPAAFKFVPESAHDVYTFYKTGAASQALQEWMDRGGSGSSLLSQEVGEIDKLHLFARLYQAKKSGKVKATAEHLWQGYWKASRLSIDMAEAILRMSAYKDYLRQMRANVNNGGRPDNFGASRPDEVMALPDVRDRAFKLANDLLGAYDDISALGREIRATTAPFWSFQEINMHRAYRFFANAGYAGGGDGGGGQEPPNNGSRNYDEGGWDAWRAGRRAAGAAVRKSPFLAYKIGKLLLRMGAFWALVTAWNMTFFRKEYDELSEELKAKPTIILGRDKDGQVIHTPHLGAMAELLDWFGLDAPQRLVRDFMEGNKSAAEIAAEMVKAPANKLVGSLTPLMKIPAELMSGKSFFPDAFNPRNIRDRVEYIAKQFNLENELHAAEGKPSRGYLNSWWNAAFDRIDQGSTAYYDIMDAKKKFLASKGIEDNGFTISPRSEALHNIRLALHLGDEKAYEKYLIEYLSMGGSFKQMNRSYTAMNPLAGLSAADRVGFIASLNERDQEKLSGAMEYYLTYLAPQEHGEDDEGEVEGEK